jgi:nucleoside-diphosphate-sugar epimerase
VSKKLAEEAIWDFVKQRKPSFHVTVFCPPLLYAPMLQYVPSADKANFSTSLIYKIMNSAKSESGLVPQSSFPGYIDTRDLVELHIAALTNPKAANKRFLVGFPMKNDTLAASLRKIPELKGRIGRDNKEEIILPRFDTSEAEEVFGLKWRTLDDTMRDTAKSFLALEAKA